MKQIFLSFLIGCLPITSLFSFVPAAFPVFDQVLHTLEGVSLFQGDRHGEFQGNLVALLSDGSGWKVHPEDSLKFVQWQTGEWLHVEVRTSFYFFKREHKFLLYNHARNESVRAMLVFYGEPPLAVASTSEPYPTNIRMVPIYGTNDEGDAEVLYYVPEPCDYRMRVLLSNGTEWTLMTNFNDFFPGVRVFLGYNMSDQYVSFFLVRGLEREAAWAWCEGFLK